MKHDWKYDEDLGMVCEACGSFHYRSIEDEECPGHHSMLTDACIIFTIIGLIALGFWAAFFGLGA